MFSRLKQYLNQKPEDSVWLRLVILAAMMVPLFALGRTRPDMWPHVVLAAVGMMAGHYYSYLYRYGHKKVVRGLMFIAIHLALCWMFIGLATGGTIPQAQFAIFAQAITSFDLRYRSNLFNTLIHSLANLYVVATLSRTTELAIYLILFTVLVLVAFFIAEKESGESTASAVVKTSGHALPTGWMFLFGFSFGGIALLAIFIMFLITPRFSNRPIVPPFTINLPLRGGTSAEIINPGLPLVQVNGWNDGDSDYYYGFDTNLDLRYRGGLSDAIVMYVRSPSRSYWRSHSYDTYNGTTWGQGDQTLIDVEDKGVYFELPAPLGAPEPPDKDIYILQDGRQVLNDPPGPPRHIMEIFDIEGGPEAQESWATDQQIVQTYNIVRTAPNLVFTAYRPAEIFMATERLSLDKGDGLRLPEPLRAGMTYSVVSYRPNFDPNRLRQLTDAVYPPDINQRYLQLPGNISPRVRQLALNITKPYTNTFDKIQALNDHLRTNYPYNYFPPPHPPGAEVVDQFLFVDQEGVCEQYGTALVVMARSLGIPARLTVGYGAGRLNPVTGYYEVRVSDAHAWTEVYFPEIGWVPFDPTPGWTPHPYPTPVQNWLLSNNGQLVRQLTGLDIPVRSITTGIVAGTGFFAPFLLGSALFVGIAMLGLFSLRRLWRWWLAQRQQKYSRLTDTPAPHRRQILRIYRQGARLFKDAYGRRHRSETLAEYARRVGELSNFTQLTRLAEQAFYDPEISTPQQVQAASEALEQLKSEVKGNKNALAG
jgi:transglutaminase-like putative cysteine protease